MQLETEVKGEGQKGLSSEGWWLAGYLLTTAFEWQEKEHRCFLIGLLVVTLPPGGHTLQ